MYTFFNFPVQKTNKLTTVIHMPRTIICLILSFALFSGKCTERDSTVTAPGVSERLAQSRSAAIGDVEYQLHFFIPEARDKAVRGQEVLSFELANRQDVVIDFQCVSPAECQVQAVNGKRAKEVEASNEHILIPAKYLRKGHNQVEVSFVSGDRSLNRHDDFLYTLFVPDHARSVFPCFDQPDLKARFQLTLTHPTTWTSVSAGKELSRQEEGESTTVRFEPSQQIPTYLFSFVAGQFEKSEKTREGRTVTALYRETDYEKKVQLDKVFDYVFHSLHWMEAYTGITMPFSKYDFVVIPGFQFGGMEHVGAIQFVDREIFLDKNPTPEEELVRLELIAHETAHLWFGDMVTMRWFNDVWCKEVFANYLAAKISRELMPEINHDLNFMTRYQIASMEEDRSEGTHPIQQPLDNLNHAGLLYGNIIYDKAPVMMRKLEELAGSEAFRRGLQNYLKTYAYGNATWDDLVECLDQEAPHAGLKAFSHAWVKEKGMPVISTTILGDHIVVRQQDPYGRGLTWRQRFSIGLTDEQTGAVRQVDIDMDATEQSLSIPKNTLHAIPNYDGMGYGRFTTSKENLMWQYEHWHEAHDETSRLSMLMNINEARLLHQLSLKQCFACELEGLRKEHNPLIASTCVSYATTAAAFCSGEERRKMEHELWIVSQSHPLPSVRQRLMRSLFNLATDSTIINHFYRKWENCDDSLLNENDYINMSYQLALRFPMKWKDITKRQHDRLTNPDRIKEYEYVSRACNPDSAVQSQLFLSLLRKENRQVEPWAESLLRLLNSPLRQTLSIGYVTPGLEALEDIQRTSDIFFPKKWCAALLSGHYSREAFEKVRRYVDAHPQLSLPLKNKLLQTTGHLNYLYGAIDQSDYSK